MQIVFNSFDCGFGNNGGTRTIVRSAETLSQMGHEVVLFSNIPNGYTWHKPEGIEFVRSSKQPACDLSVSVGLESIDNVLQSKAKKKVQYIRGYETWKMSPKALLRSYRKLPVIVNSQWLYEMMEKNHITSTLIYPGLDEYWAKTIPSSERPIALGGLYSTKHTTKRHTVVDGVANILDCKLEMLNKHITEAGPKELTGFYNRIKVWLAPTVLEGLHNPPIEACMCGCAVVCSNNEQNGMGDYAYNGFSAMVYKDDDIGHASECVKTLLEDDLLRLRMQANMAKLLKDKMGSRQKNMHKLLKAIGDV